MLRLFVFLFLLSINSKAQALIVGAQQVESYSELLRNKRLDVVVNQTSRVNDVHLIDFLLQNNFKFLLIPI